MPTDGPSVNQTPTSGGNGTSGPNAPTPPTAACSSRTRGRGRCTQGDVERIIKGAQKAKLPIGAIRVEPDGTILIIPGTPEALPSAEPNPWDKVS